jgi:N-acetylmuramoyl-L-alanine amidase
MKKKVNYNEELSPNFSKRNEKIKYIIIHYTGTKSLLEALNIFRDKNSQVSCHWLISKRGKLYKIVDEKNVAWHAGISYWKGEKMLNNNSIGIELDNIGHGLHYKIFSNIQMSVLEKLLKLLINKYKIKKQNILGHSDIAPGRKLDPGELFNWERLAEKNLAYYPLVKRKNVKKFFYKLGDRNKEIILIKLKLIKIGYKCSQGNYFDIDLKLVVEAFQRRFLPEKINGIIDEKVYFRILEVSKNA